MKPHYHTVEEVRRWFELLLEQSGERRHTNPPGMRGTLQSHISDITDYIHLLNSEKYDVTRRLKKLESEYISHGGDIQMMVLLLELRLRIERTWLL